MIRKLLPWLGLTILVACGSPATTQTPVPPTETPIPTASVTPTEAPTATPLYTPTIPPEVVLTETAVHPFPIEEVRFTTEDGVELAGRLFGDGDIGVVMAHQGTRGTTQDSWFYFAMQVAGRGFTALTYDARGWGQSGGSPRAAQMVYDTNAAIAFLRGLGHERIVCMGASMGGTACLASAVQDDQLAGLVVIASPMNSGYPTRALPQDMSKLTMPKLFICAEDDIYRLVVTETERMHGLSPQPKQLKFFPGTEHGTELFYSPYAAEFTTLLLEFLDGLRQSG